MRISRTGLAVPVAKTHNLRVALVCQNMTTEGQQRSSSADQQSRRSGLTTGVHKADGQQAQYTG